MIVLIRGKMVAALLAAAAILAGCALSRPSSPPVVVQAPGTAAMDLAWHAARFRFEWPEGAEPAWHRDLMLAHRVVGPVLAARQDRIPLWRFHRRAVRDATGHQFSFVFYADVATATEIMDALRTDALLATLQNKGIVTSIHFSDPRKSQQPAVADTADKQWSPAVQRTWPYFIMGASRMWLAPMMK